MLNEEWLRSYDTLRVIARNEAIQTNSFGNEQKADCENGWPFFVMVKNFISYFCGK